MTKPTSCGLILRSNDDHVLLVHPTNQNFWDFPKGVANDGENHFMAAIRETYEETGVDMSVDEYQVTDLGKHDYNNKKFLHMFEIIVDRHRQKFNITKMHCKSYFTHKVSKTQIPEVDDFMWVPLSTAERMLPASMKRYLTRVKEVNVT